MAAPDHRDATLGEHRGQRRGLRIVQDHHVPRGDLIEEGGGVAGHHSGHQLLLRRRQPTVITLAAVQPVVQPLGQREEHRVALDDEPPARDTHAEREGQQDVEHLRDAAARSGRVHVDDPVARELPPPSAARRRAPACRSAPAAPQPPVPGRIAVPDVLPAQHCLSVVLMSPQSNASLRSSNDASWSGKSSSTRSARIRTMSPTNPTSRRNSPIDALRAGPYV